MIVIVFQPGAMSRLGGHVWEGIVPTLRAEAHGGDNEPHILIIDGRRTNDVRVTEGVVFTLEARMGTGGNNVPLITTTTDQLFTNESFGAFGETTVAGTLRTNIEQAHMIVQATNVDDFNNDGGSSIHHTLRGSSSDKTGVMIEAIPIQGTMIGRQDHNGPGGVGAREPGAPMYTLETISTHAIEHNTVVRRLTPIECERLMGWPDNHTLHRADGRTNADSTRYKMCGNGVASPVAEWIGGQILAWEGSETAL